VISATRAPGAVAAAAGRRVHHVGAAGSPAVPVPVELLAVVDDGADLQQLAMVGIRVPE